MPAPTPDDIRKAREQAHGLGLTEPGLWQGTGFDLLRAARLLIVRTLAPEPDHPPDIRVLGPGLMLRGFGVENLLKARHLKQGGAFTPKKPGNIPGCGSHALIEMTRAVSIEVDSDEEQALRSLQTSIQHAGRYPIGRFPDQSIVHLQGYRDDRSVWSAEHERVFECYLWRLIAPLLPPMQSEAQGNAIPSPTWHEVLSSWMRNWVCT
jgi:hypothetical protein